MSIYAEVLSDARSLPVVFDDFADMCGKNKWALKNELNDRGLTFTDLRNKERDKRLMEMSLSRHAVYIAVEFGFRSTGSFYQWHHEYYGFTWTERKKNYGDSK
jgi:hypothetical protein